MSTRACEAHVIDESRLRHPSERAIYAATVVVNLALMAAAIYFTAYSAEWLESYPRLARWAGALRAAAVLAIMSPPALVVLRNTRRAVVTGSAVPLSRAQLPEIHSSFERFCEALGMRPAPDLFLTEDAIDEVSNAYSSWRSNYVVLRSKFLESDLAEVRDVYEFFLAREIGRVRLGHTQWWDELLLSYVVQIPYLRNPLAHVRTYSHDRYALALAPDSVRGLVVQAAGRHMLKRMSVAEYLRQAITFGGFWVRVASLTRRSPHVALRVRRLYEAGLLDLDPTAAAPVAAPPGALSLAMPAARAARRAPGADGAPVA
jgi:hypothetical protein